MLKMVDGTGIIGVDMVCPLGGAVSPPQPPNYDNVEMEGVGSLMLPNSLKAPLERLELIGNSAQGENPSPDNPQEIKSAGKWNERTQKYEIDVKVTGTNLFDAKKAKSGWISSDGKQTLATLGSIDNVVSDYIQVYPGMKYTSSVGVYKYFYDSEKIFLKQDASISSSIIIPDNAKYMIVIVSVNKHLAIQTANTLMINIGSSVLQIENGTIRSNYEPYTEQSVQIALDEPLRGIGEYKDVLTKDGVVRKIYPPYEINLNDLRDGGYEKTNTVMFSVKVQNKTVGYASSKPSILCNILPDCVLQTSNIYNNDKECIAVGGGIVLFRVNKSRLKDISSFEAIKQSFIELMEGKKMLVEYALETPVTEPLPESVQQQLQALHSENGVTHVFVDSGEVPCGIKLTYRKEK